MTHDEIHNIWLHMSGKSEGLLEAGSKADLPVLFANAILEYNKRQWQGLTDEEREQVINANFGTGLWQMAKDIEAKLKEKNA
jgi:hypothetical protein